MIAEEEGREHVLLSPSADVNARVDQAMHALGHANNLPEWQHQARLDAEEVGREAHVLVRDEHPTMHEDGLLQRTREVLNRHRLRQAKDLLQHVRLLSLLAELGLELRVRVAEHRRSVSVSGSSTV